MLAFVLTCRLQTDFDKIIEIIVSKRAGYIKNEFIHCKIRLIEDLIDYNNRLDIETSILDFQKHFECVKWPFMLDNLNILILGTNS